MNPQIKTIAETMEKASTSRISLDDAEQQIKSINADGDLQSIKTNALQILIMAKSEVASYANDKAMERLKAFRRASVPLSSFAQSIRSGGL
jgi:hypothetical protein